MTGLNLWNWENPPKIAFYAVANDQPLPVDLIDFKVRIVDKQSVLNWTVASETNNTGRLIQRSDNGLSWNTVGWVDGKLNSNEKSTYNFSEKMNKSGLFFYRIVQVDLDGTKSYSDVESVEFKHNNFQCYPNPVEGELFLDGIEKNTAYELFDLGGTKLRRGVVNGHELIDVRDFGPGKYFVRVGD